MESTTNSLQLDKLASVAVLHQFQQNIATQDYEKFDRLSMNFNSTLIPKIKPKIKHRLFPQNYYNLGRKLILAR